jgi:peptide/nickel transport system permease protein
MRSPDDGSSAALTPRVDPVIGGAPRDLPPSLWLPSWQRFRRHRPALVGLWMIALLVAATLGGPLAWSRSPERIDFPSARQGATLEHPFGTDQLGRDLLARVLAGGRVSLSVGILAIAVSSAIGVLVGAVAGYAGSWVDGGLMRLTDLFLTIPMLPVLILCTALFATDGTFARRYLVVVIVIGALNWMVTARLVRASFLSLKEAEFVTAARAIGARPGAIVLRHILPNALGPVIVTATLGVGATVIIESSLSFLGLGFQPPQATWGRMLFEAQPNLTTAPHEAIGPGCAIISTVLAINTIGDGLRDALDPYGGRRIRR